MPEVAAELVSIWTQLELHGAAVHRIPLDDLPARDLKKRLNAEARRLRAINETAGRTKPDTLAWLDLDRLAAIDPEDDTWRAVALCIGRTSDFYPADGDTSTARNARAICELCPALYSCLATAVHTGCSQPSRDFGIWGRTSALERRRIVRALAARKAAA